MQLTLQIKELAGLELACTSGAKEIVWLAQKKLLLQSSDCHGAHHIAKYN